MPPNLWSLLTTPSLFAVWLTALFGLNAVRPPTLRQALTWPGAVDFCLGASFLVMTYGSFQMLMAVALGGNIYTWRGCLLMWGVAGAFVFAGHYHPWRRFIRRMVSIDQIERQWRGTGAPSTRDLRALIAEGRRALHGPVGDRAEECMRVMPHIVAALERVAVRQLEITDIRADLKSALSELHDAMAYNRPTAEPVQRINTLLDRLEGAMQHG
jgi:hypothetical protein